MRKNGKNSPLGENILPSFLSFCKRFAKWGLVFLYSVWIFVLGILVGRDSAPVKFDTEKLQKELAVLREAVIRQEQEEFQIDRETLLEDKPAIFDFHEELRSSDENFPMASEPPEKEDEEKDKLPDAVKTEPDPPKENISLPEKTALVTKREDLPEKAASKIKRAAPPEKTSKPAPPPPKPSAVAEKAEAVPESERNITIQVASFSNQEDAENMVSRLKSKGYPAYRVSGDVAGKGTFHRVRVGYFKTRAHGKSMRERLKQDNFNSFFINCD
jgi:cell division septation protein DedD